MIQNYTVYLVNYSYMCAIQVFFVEKSYIVLALHYEIPKNRKPF